MDRILLYYPGLSFQIDEGAKHRFDSFINSYKELYDVTVLASIPLNSWKYFFQRKKYLNGHANWIFIPMISFYKNEFIKFISILLAQLSIYILTLFHHYKFIQVEHNIGGLAARYRNGIPLIVDFHGDSLDEELFKRQDLNLNSPRIRLIRESTYKCVRYANYFIFVSENLKLEIEKHGNFEINHYSILPCCVDIDKFLNSPKKKLPQIEKRIVLGYCGGLQKWQNIDIILNIVIKLREINNKYYLLLLTNHSTSMYSDLLNKIGKENFCIMRLPNKEVPSYLHLIDVSFLIRDNRSLNIVSSPTKISESMAAGVPIIATKSSGDIAEIVNEGVNGLILKNSNITDENISLINQFVQNVKQNRGHIRALCQQSVQHRTWNHFFAKHIQNISNI